MTKTILTLLLTLFSYVCLCQSIMDTLFLKREKTDSSYNIVYVETDTNLYQYNDLIPKRLDSNEINNIEQQYKQLSHEAKSIRSFELKDFPKEWSNLYTYEEKHYVYYPSDSYFINSYQFTDSLLIKHTGEEPVPHLYSEIEKISDVKYKFTILSHTGIQVIKIYIVDLVKGIAIWELTRDKASYCLLMVDSKNVKDYPIAIHHCSVGKCLYEFKFENPDLESVINTAW